MANNARGGARTFHGTTTTNADVEVVTLDRPYRRVLVNNWSTTDSLYVTIDRDDTQPLAPSVGLAGSYRVAPNAFLELADDAGLTSANTTVRIFCNTSATPYSVSGTAT